MSFNGETPHDGKEETMDTSESHEHQHRGSSSPQQEYDKDSDSRSSHRKNGKAAPPPEKPATDEKPGHGGTDQK
jgi:hypothetical protein